MDVKDSLDFEYDAEKRAVSISGEALDELNESLIFPRMWRPVGPRGDCYRTPDSPAFTRLQEEAALNHERINALISPETYDRILSDRVLGRPFPLSGDPDRKRVAEITGLGTSEIEELIEEFHRFQEIQFLIAEELARENFPDRRRFPQNVRMRELVIDDVMWVHFSDSPNRERILCELLVQRACPVTTEERFIESIAADPFDLVTPLIFADWLEERNQPGDTERAELIRLQCRLEGMAENDPERKAVSDRANEILEQHQAGWAERIGCKGGVTWRRGFIEGVRMSLEDFAESHDLFLEPVRELTIPELTDPYCLPSRLKDIERIVIDRVNSLRLTLFLWHDIPFPQESLASLKEVVIPAGSLTRSEIRSCEDLSPSIKIVERP